MSTDNPIFGKSMAAMIISIVFLIVYLLNAGKSKTAFTRVDGIIESIMSTNEHYPGKDSSRFRYIQIDNYPKPFEVFIGKAASDFKAELEHIEYLQPGDLVTIYFEETAKTEAAAVNNLARFIDRGEEPIFREGNSKRSLIYGLIGFCTVFSLVLLLLRRMGKIN
jgi:hypothetical protein